MAEQQIPDASSGSAARLKVLDCPQAPRSTIIVPEHFLAKYSNRMDQPFFIVIQNSSKLHHVDAQDYMVLEQQHQGKTSGLEAVRRIDEFSAQWRRTAGAWVYLKAQSVEKDSEDDYQSEQQSHQEEEQSK